MGKRNFYDDEDYGRGKKKHGKGHQRRHGKSESEFWEEQMEIEEEIYVEPVKIPAKTTPIVQNSPQNPQKNTQKPLQFGPNTRSVNGINIDYDRVVNMEKIESFFKGRQTYGIKYSFRKAGSQCFVWFNANKKSRDDAYVIEFAFWKGLQK